jgi:predicted Zn-dependent protease
LALNQNGKPAEAAKEQEVLRQTEADVRRVRQLLLTRLQDAPNDPAVPYEVATIALRAGQPREALRWLQNALRVGPNHLPTHRALAALYYETGNPILSAKHRAIAQRLSSK